MKSVVLALCLLGTNARLNAPARNVSAGVGADCSETHDAESYVLEADEATARRHRWYFYPRMRGDERLLFKIADTRADVAQRAFHAAFDDPSEPRDVPPRQALAVRAVAIFDP